ncbi:LysR family transcriptional regulator (plasmid) [Photobacterium sp. DA100]|uniref:LysR substrate-binding domain-containing protein n=1 Tax=Photobacterium sp. DA100 TaxID=3027472 RepID=UPI002479D37B|nr:LysR family transcriptional regulator [Photobacterium sp. DA100]WEM45524.1 LysR family transcriptional regulator [Photobacterium sp. DA100]
MNKLYSHFILVAQMKNMSKAAEVLGVSQPTLSLNLKKLEAQFDVNLFVRRSKGIELSEYGELLYEEAMQIQRQETNLQTRMTKLKARNLDQLKIGTGDVWWELFLKEAVARFCRKHPAVAINCAFGNHLKLMDMLIQGEVDMFIGHEIKGLSRKCNVQFMPLVQDKEAFFVSKFHPLTLKQKVTSDDMYDYPMVCVTPDSQRYNHLLEDSQPKRNDMEEKSASERILYEIESLQASIDMLNITNAIMPYASHIQGYLENCNLVALDVVDLELISTIGIYIRNGEIDAKTRDIINEIPNLV